MRNEVRVLPNEFLERLKTVIPSHKWDSVANTFAEPKPTTLRANSLKISPEMVRERLERSCFRLEAVPWYSDAFILREGRLRELQETELYQKGEVYVQSLSSMIPPLVLDPKPGERILDLTAAPGSKTTQMAALMKNEGRILANDNNKIRFFKLRANLELQGVTNAGLSMRYGESLGRERPNEFDRVLLDAPCSVEGRFDIRQPASYGYWKPKKVLEMARKQRKLILSALKALRRGGILVYSTCTFAPEENEGVINFALEKLKDEAELEPIQFPISNQMSGLVSWGKERFHPSLKKAVRIFPNHQMEGFFIARIRKKG